MPEPEEGDDAATDEDPSFLREKLLEVKAACENYDESAADSALSELKEKSWSRTTKELLNTIAENLLHSDFDEIVEVVDKFIEDI